MSDKAISTNRFLVDWGGSRTSFYEVTGLTIEHDLIEHRSGSSREVHSRKIPGLATHTPIILKRDLIKDDNEFFEWVNTIQFNQVERRDLTISLLDEESSPVFAWLVKSAWPIRLSYSNLKSDVSENAMEVLELAHEGITVRST